MNRGERFYRIDQLLTARKVVTRQELLDELEISWATLKRDLAFLKDRFNAPIIHDRDAGGYRFAEPGAGPSYELPGLWFNADETYALLTMHRLLSDLEPRLLAPHVAPLLSRLESILGQEGQRFDEIAQRSGPPRYYEPCARSRACPKRLWPSVRACTGIPSP